MPVLSFGDRKNGWSKSCGRSSIQTLSSFCQSVSRPSLRRAPLTTSSNGLSAPGAAACGGAPGGRRPDAAAAGGVALAGPEAAAAGAAVPAAATGVAVNVCNVVQPDSAAATKKTGARMRSVEERTSMTGFPGSKAGVALRSYESVEVPGRSPRAANAALRDKGTAGLSASAGSAAAAAWRPPRRGASSCRPRTRGSCRRRRTTASRPRPRGCGCRCGRGTSGRGEITSTVPANSSSASSSARSVSTSRSLDGSSSSSTLPPSSSVLARCRRPRSPPESLPTSFCWSSPLKLKRPR